MLNTPCGRETLPPLSKKIIYIDQFALSYMVRALHPEMKATGNSEADYFWLQLYQKLDKLIKMQIIICPQSHFHLAESIVSSFLNLWKRCTSSYQEVFSFQIRSR